MEFLFVIIGLLIIYAVYIILQFILPIGLLYLLIGTDIEPAWLWCTLLIVWFVGNTIICIKKEINDDRKIFRRTSRSFV